jgi:hypothetical protein
MTRFVTEDDRRMLGDDVIHSVSNVALESLAPHIQQLAMENQRLQNANQSLHQRVTRDAVFRALDAELGRAWRTTNVDEHFKQWVATTIYPLSGQSFHQMMLDALGTGRVNAIAEVFRRYWQEAGQQAPVTGRAQGNRAPSGRFADQVTPKDIAAH